MLTADPRVVAGAGARARAVVRRSVRAGLLRREGAAPEHHPAGRREEHPGPHPQLAASRGEGNDDHRRRDGAMATTLTALACKRGVTVIDITSTRMLMAHRVPAPAVRGVRTLQDAVDVVTTSEVSVSVTVDNTAGSTTSSATCATSPRCSTEPDMAIVCIVGEEPAVGSDAVRSRGHCAAGRAAAAGLAGRIAPQHHLRACATTTCDDRHMNLLAAMSSSA